MLCALFVWQLRQTELDADPGERIIDPHVHLIQGEIEFQSRYDNENSESEEISESDDSELELENIENGVRKNFPEVAGPSVSAESVCKTLRRSKRSSRQCVYMMALAAYDSDQFESQSDEDMEE